MKSLLQLWKTMADELAIWCNTCATKDYQTVLRRTEDEGISFLTITMANFATDFQKSLAQGFVADDSFPGFQKRAGLPMFLSGFLQLVFSTQDARLRDDPSIDAVFAVRQLTLAFQKIAIDCSPARVDRAISGYVACEQDLKALIISDEDMLSFEKTGMALFAQMFSDVDRDIYEGHIRPKHGPGATADRLSGNRKWDQQQWTQRLDAIFPFGEYALPSWYSRITLADRAELVEILEPRDEIPVRVITVPKTLKTPRIIAIEPTCMQYMQQGILRAIIHRHNDSEILRVLIGFDDQEPNRVLARHGSLSGQLATLDLSEASDRVSNQLVRALLKRFPYFQEAVDATRSRKADVPGHGVIRLTKFASMGSALCFPFEAFVFTTIIFDAIGRQLNRHISPELLDLLKSSVRVYGDDIIVPVEFVASVQDRLKTFGFKVNVNKSFSEGNFRESCGGDYFFGEDVTPVRVRKLLPTERSHALEVASASATRNLFYQRGMWKTAAYLDRHLLGVIKHYPVVGERSSMIGRLSFLSPIGEKQCPRLHRPLNKGFTLRGITPKSHLSEEAALLKFHLVRSEIPDAPIPDGHLSHAGRDLDAYLKLGWSSPI